MTLSAVCRQLVCIALVAAAATSHGATPDRVLTGVVAARSSGNYIEVPFPVPAGVVRLTVTFSYTGREDRAVLDLGIADPQRVRGWSGGNKARFTIGIPDATPSFLPGPLPPGTWKLLIGVANLRPAHTARYHAEIFFERAGSPVQQGFTDHPLADRAGWYRGDLHMHTGHSDGTCTSQAGAAVPCPVFVTMQAAAARGLDFIAITDHNAMSQYDAMREQQPYFDRLLLIPGRELTTYRGHANVFGTTAFLDFRTEASGHPTAATMFRQAHALGALVSINHPVAPDDERCVGCGWIADPQATREADAIEAVNGGDARLHALDIAYWERQIAGGHRVTAIGGSDTHQPERGTVGRPTTIVYASSLSVPGILAGIRAGHVCIDVEGTKDRLLEFTASDGTQQAMMGDALQPKPGAAVTLTMHVQHSGGAVLHLLLDGNEKAPLLTKALSSDDETATTVWTSDGKRHWIRAETVSAAPGGEQQRTLLLGNPVYLNWSITNK